jgi:hypothetical protein
LSGYFFVTNQLIVCCSGGFGLPGQALTFTMTRHFVHAHRVRGVVALPYGLPVDRSLEEFFDEQRGCQ